MSFASLAQSGRDLVEIHNSSGVVQSVFDAEGMAGPAGRRYDIAAHGNLVVSSALASLFTGQRQGYVVRRTIAEIPRVPGEPIIWVANVTGNPWLPKEVKLKRINKGVEEDYLAPNPLLDPVTLTNRMRGDQVIVSTPDGSDKETKWMPEVVIAIPAFTRVGLSKRYAQWVLARDERQEIHHIGKVVQCRPPRSDGFEPNISWGLGELQDYARYAFPDEVWSGHEELLGKDPSDYRDEAEQAAAADTLCKALFFLVVREEYSLPEPEAFAAHQRQLAKMRDAVEKGAISDDDLAKAGSAYRHLKKRKR